MELKTRTNQPVTTSDGSPVSSGTKLYKHSIQTNSQQYTNIIVITTLKDEFSGTMVSVLDGLYDTGKFFYISFNAQFSQAIYDYDNSSILYFSNDNIMSIDANEIAITDDEVTEL